MGALHCQCMELSALSEKGCELVSRSGKSQCQQSRVCKGLGHASNGKNAVSAPLSKRSLGQ